MKKLKLSELDLGNAELLTREQLKKVLGGQGSGGSGPLCGPGEQAHNCTTYWDSGQTTGAYNCAISASQANLNVEHGYETSGVTGWSRVQCS